jgi:outer membrane usher protein
MLTAIALLLSSAAALSQQDSATTPAPPASGASDKIVESQNIEDIYKSVFGRDRPTIEEGDYAIIIDGQLAGEYRVRPPNDQQKGAIAVSVVETVIAPLTIDTIAEQLRAIKGDGTMAPLDALREAGLFVEFDPANLALKIEIPLALRTERLLNLRSARALQNLEVLKQSDFSAYASVRTGLTFVEDSRFIKSGLNRVSADVDLGMNIGGAAIEGQIRYDDARRRRFSRGDIRLTYDDRKSLIRYEVGDLSVGRRPFQNASRIAGIGAFRNYGINPYLNIRPSPVRGFELQQPARVEVIVNGNPLRTFDLQSGRYNLQDFSLIPAAGNDIELRITYASGATEIRSFPAFFDLELLRPGMLDFGLNFGLPYRDDNGIRRYNDNDYNGSAYVRYGLTDTFTAGINWEGSRSFNLIGAEAVWASPIGTFGVNASTSATRPVADTSQLSIQYRLRDTDIERDRTLEGVITLTGRDHRTLNDQFSGGFVAKQARLRASQAVTATSRIQLNAGYEEFRGGLGKSYNLGISYSRQFRFGSINVGAEYRKSRERSGPIFNLGLNIPLGRASIASSYTSEDHSARIDYNQLSAPGVNALGYSFSAERRTGGDRQSGRLNFIGNRFEASLVQTARDYFSRNGNNRDLRSDLTFGTALMFADGDLAIGPPIRNSFAIFKANKKAGNYKLAVDPRTNFGNTETRYSAYSGTLGPASITSLTPYFNRTVQVDAPDAPAGTSLGGQVYAFNPGYRSGYRIIAGSEENVSVIGNMVDRDGDPLKYVTVEIVEESGDTAAKTPSQIFTNASGRFFAEGLQSGKSYALSVTIGGKKAHAKIAIPGDISGMYRMDGYLFFEVDVEKEKSDDGGK